MINNTFVITCIRNDYIQRCLETLYLYTDMKDNRVIVVDQTLKGLGDLKGVHLTLRVKRNLGFAKANNEGMIHGLHWKSKYITCLNDDTEMINSRWWQGIVDTFNMPSDKEIIAVAPESPKVPSWGYGRNYGEFIEILPYKEKYTEADYDYLLKGDFSDLKKKCPDLPKTFPLNYVGVCDAFAAWSPVFKASALATLGLWDERFYPGGGDDYDMDGRIYSKNYRAVSTRKSWTYHHWGKSRDESKERDEQGLPIEKERNWNNLGDLWPPEWNEENNLCVWGYYTSKIDGRKKAFKRVPEIAVIDI